MSGVRTSHTVLDAIEAAYRVDLPPNEWLRGLADEFYHQLGGGAGLYGCAYRIIDGARLKVAEELRIDMPETVQLPFREGLEMMPAEFLRAVFTRSDCATQSQFITAEHKPFIDNIMAPLASTYGWRDILCFSGVDPAGHGVYLGSWLREPRRVLPAQREQWKRVTVHVVTALRLRRRLAEACGAVEAVLTPSGKLEHAEDEATPEAARASLRAAVQAVERARGKLRRADPERAVASWKGLVAARWSLVDQFESDGKRYVLARRNDVRLKGLAALTDRERQVVAHAALGHSNKLIAYELGVAASTVSVLLHRAARKLGTETRQELIAAYERLSRHEAGE